MAEKEKEDKEKTAPTRSADLKVVIIGNPNSGKTSLVNRYIHDKFSNNYKATLGSQFDYKILQIKETIYRIHFWDLGGQDRNIQVTNLFARDCNGIVIVFDTTEEQSKADTLLWKETVLQNNNNTNQAIILIENKSDLIEGGDEAHIEDLEKFASDNGFDKAFRTSAKTAFGVEKAFLFLFNTIIERNGAIEYKAKRGNETLVKRDPNNLNMNDQTKKRKKCC